MLLLNQAKYQPHVRVRVWFGSGSCLGSCLVRVGLVSGFASVSCLVRVRFVSGSCLGWCMECWLVFGSCPIRVWFVSGFACLFQVWFGFGS